MEDTRNSDIQCIDLTEEEYRPCRFKPLGCRTAVTDRQTAKHESQCLYRPLPCPSVLPKCTWKGTVARIGDHFLMQHPDLVKDRAEMTLKLRDDSKGLLMVVQDSFPFLIKYSFGATHGNFKYDVRLCQIGNGYEATCKVELVQDSVSGCSIGFTIRTCDVYNGKPKFKIVNLREFVVFLRGQDSVRVIMKLKVIAKSNNLLVDSNSLICQKCLKCLVPPVFEFKSGMLCCICSKKYGNDNRCTQLQDTRLLKLVKEAVYTCPWISCQFVGKASAFRDHESQCLFRLYDCFFPSNICTKSFPFADMVNHLKKDHSVVYLPDLTAYKTSFRQICSKKMIVTVRDRVLVLLEYEIKKDDNKATLIHCVDVVTSACEFRRISGTVYFEHSHCKRKSRQFLAGSKIICRVGLDQLPPCFKATDRLSVNVNLKAE